MGNLFCNLKIAWDYARNQKFELIKYILGNLLEVVISIVVPIFSAKIIILLTDRQFVQLIFISIVIFLVENIRNLIHYFSRYYSQLIYRESFTRIQTDLGRQILRLENRVIDENSSGIFIQRLTNDTSRLADIFNVFSMYLSNIITCIGVFGAIFILHKVVFVYLVVMVFVLYLVENRRVKIYHEEDKKFRQKNERVSGFVGEIVRGVRDIKMLNSEDSFIDSLHQKVIALNRTRYDMQNVDRKYRLFCSFLRDFTDLFLIILLVVLIQNHSLEIASALIIHNYSWRVFSLVDYIGMFLDQVKDFNLSCSRIFSILHGDEFQKESFGIKHLDRVKGNFCFQHVAFSYGKEKVLDDVSFQIKANETVAFVGKSGVGKTTIFNLLCKMYDVNDGEIMIDGVNIQELDRESIRGNITIISQNPYIFNLSIRDNLRLVKSDITDEEMKEACKLACLDDFIQKLPDSYDTIIGEGGVNLSGGQKQRLAIARAFVQKTEIILFDEATSALDNETQEKIQEAIENMKKEYTILIIAHRLSTIIHADRILFLDDGKIVAEGTHRELLKTCSNYRKLYEAEIMKN